MNMIADIETLYARLGERDYEAVMCIWLTTLSGSWLTIRR
jgi:hypothetical protein